MSFHGNQQGSVHGYNPPYPQQQSGYQSGGPGIPHQGPAFPQYGPGYPQQMPGYPQPGPGHSQQGLGYPQQNQGVFQPKPPFPQQNTGYIQGHGMPYQQSPGHLQQSSSGNATVTTNAYPQATPAYSQGAFGYPQGGSAHGSLGYQAQPMGGPCYGQGGNNGTNIGPGVSLAQSGPTAQSASWGIGPSGNSTQGYPGRTFSQDQYATKVELRIECRNLLNKDIMSKSDPCAVLYLQRQGRWEEVSRTENVINSLNPRFSTPLKIGYLFEEVQKVRISVYDIDNATPQLTDDDFLGQIETTLGQLVSGSPYTKPLLLANGYKAGNGVIIVSAEEIKEGAENVALTFRAQKLDKMDFFGKSDPYLEILRSTPGGSWQLVHRTEVVKNNLNPSWRPFELSVNTLCGGNKRQIIKFDVYDWDSDGSHDYIGGFSATLEDMLQAQQHEVSWPCVNPTKKAKKKNYNNSGVVVLSSCKLIKVHSFLDYIFGRMQVNFTVGIDFTASNGNPLQPSSLHYISPHQPNEYMQAIRAVGDVCQDYDSDKMFPALGFGAKIPPSDQVMHEFAINFNPQNPFCSGIDGVLQAYYTCIQRVQLYGPTNASPIIRHVANFAAAAQREEPQKGAHAYFILLMLTDGVLSDMSNTRDAIVKASHLPMSIIIVGVGSADFTDMNELDGDNGVLRSPSGERASRDIVQFVPFREYKQRSPIELARHVLAEVPKQVTDYFKSRGLQPNKPPL